MVSALVSGSSGPGYPGFCSMKRLGVFLLLVASCNRNWDKLRPNGSLGSYADFTFFTIVMESVML